MESSGTAIDEPNKEIISSFFCMEKVLYFIYFMEVAKCQNETQSILARFTTIKGLIVIFILCG